MTLFDLRRYGLQVLRRKEGPREDIRLCVRSPNVGFALSLGKDEALALAQVLIQAVRAGGQK